MPLINNYFSEKSVLEFKSFFCIMKNYIIYISQLLEFSKSSLVFKKYFLYLIGHISTLFEPLQQIFDQGAQPAN